MTREQERAAVREYLRQYIRAKNRREDIINRRSSIFETVKENTTAGKALIDDISRALDEQAAATAQAVKNILSVIEYLPAHSQERDVIERRYIDGMPWSRICGRLYISRSAAALWEQRGIDTLLTFERVRHLIAPHIKRGAHRNSRTGHNRTKG